jgi:uncharacterized membrane protein
MPLFGSWVELHAALTHFPIALLLVALFFDAGALALRRPAWRDMGLAILALAVASMPVGLLSGYLAGRDMGRPPVGFDAHWKAAVLTTVLSAALLVWRLRTRGQTERAPQIAMLAVAFASAGAVGYTGHMGGAMVFGGRSSAGSEMAAAPPPPSPTAAPAGDKKAADKIAVAAVRMSSALDKMGAATDRLAQKGASQPAPPAPVAAPAPPAPVAAPAPPAPIDTTPLDEAAAKMERVAARFEASAAKMEASVRRLESAGAAGAGSPVAPPAPASPASKKSNTARGAGRASPSSSAPAASVPTVPPAATAAPTLVADPRIARGKVLFVDDEIGCAGCHKISGVGGRSGPDLTYAGRLHPDISWQIAHLKDPKSKVPGSTMPAYADLPAADLEALAVYMASLK